MDEDPGIPPPDSIPARVGSALRKGSNRVWFALGIGALLVLLGLFIVGLLSFGDPDVELGLRVVNRTDQELAIYQVLGAGNETHWTTVPPGSASQIPPCGNAEFVARSEDGEVVARRAPSEGCSQAWIITSTGT